MEEYIVAKLLETRKNGISFSSYFIGYYDQCNQTDIVRGGGVDITECHINLYKESLKIDSSSYKYYLSQFGIHVLFFSGINKLFDDNLSIENFRKINSFIFSVILTFLLYLINREFGLISSIICFFQYFLAVY